MHEQTPLVLRGGGNVFVEPDELVKYERISHGATGLESAIRGW